MMIKGKGLGINGMDEIYGRFAASCSDIATHGFISS